MAISYKINSSLWNFAITENDGKYSYVFEDIVNNKIMSDLDYLYSITLWGGKICSGVENREISQNGDCIEIKGEISDSAFSFTQTFKKSNDGKWLDETVTLKNNGEFACELKDINFGLRKLMFTQANGWCDNLDDYKLMSVPTRRFRSQRIDRRKDIYTASDIMMPLWIDNNPNKKLPGYFDEGWIWMGEKGGMLTCKYNRDEIEYTRFDRESYTLPGRGREDVGIIFGGVSVFDGNPERGLRYNPGECHAFGTQRYTVFDGGFEEGYYTYREHLQANGHTIPKNYDPPVHWNELYNLGWFAENDEGGFMSDGESVGLYTLDKLYSEAQLAKDAGAESLYLDPGWDIFPGATIWDEKRLGKFSDFCDTIHNKYGLKVALHLMMTFVSENETEEFYLHGADGKRREFGIPATHSFCPNEVWVREKTRRLLELVKGGVDFFMFDFTQYGDENEHGCMDPTHGHETPMFKQTQAENIMRVIHNVKKANPNVLIEAHDRIVGGLTDYNQMYFQHGGEYSYDENWGYELMWNPMYDLVTGKAASLYEYNMASSLPLYLHINENSDNDNLISLWWYISTTRHLGIGGIKYDDPRYPKLQNAMKLYHQYKPVFARGTFYGITPTAHLHVGENGDKSALCLYNLTSRTEDIEITLDTEKYGVKFTTLKAYDGIGGSADIKYSVDGVKLNITASVKSLAPCVIVLE